MTQRTAYAEWLRARMDERGYTQRSFGRALNPDNPEAGRRSVHRYLTGMVPLERTRKVIAEVLGVDETGPAPSDEEEQDLVSMLRRQLVDLQTLVDRLDHTEKEIAA